MRSSFARSFVVLVAALLVLIACGSTPEPTESVDDPVVVPPDAAGRCPRGRTSCNGTCANTKTDSNNCGECGHACSGSEVCRVGACHCPSSDTDCNGTCTNTKTDSKNCGACGNACSGGEICRAGACQCPLGEMTCSGTCTNTKTDSKNCGICGKLCFPDEVCRGGSCDCPSRLFCNGICTDPKTDQNCGGCGNACTGGKKCIRSIRTVFCACPPKAPLLCNGVCTNLQTDNTNCGSCGNACGGGQVCSATVCQCPPATVLCGGACVSNTCAAGQTFNSSTCACECPANTVLCNGQCVSNVCTSPQTFNLGTCMCAQSSACTYGLQGGEVSINIQPCPPGYDPSQECISGTLTISASACTVGDWTGVDPGYAFFGSNALGASAASCGGWTLGNPPYYCQMQQGEPNSATQTFTFGTVCVSGEAFTIHPSIYRLFGNETPNFEDSIAQTLPISFTCP